MNAWTLHDDFLAMRARFHRALAISVGVHALLALGLILADEARPDLPRIIEVTWLETADTAPPLPVSETVVRPREERPAQKATRSAAAPESHPASRPQSDAAAQREARLAGLAATRGAISRDFVAAPAADAGRRLLAAVPVDGSDIPRLATATMMPVAQKGRPLALGRGPATGGHATALKRGPGVADGGLSRAAVVAAAADGADNGGTAAAQAATTTRPAGVPGDVIIAGPASDRPVRDSVLPSYPDWARRQAIEAAVTLHFTVLPDGRVREDVRVERTGGFGDFDERAVAALRQWRFAALPGGDNTGQWGTITFRYRLRG